MSEHGEFFWNEFNTHDVEKAKKFYSDTLGWTFDEVPMEQGGVYHVIKLGDKMVGGMFEFKGPEFKDIPSHWMSYISVDDVDSRIQMAQKCGGKLIKPIMDIPEVGRFGIVEDPCGGYIAWITPSD